jgi:D-arabinose 1-dehydrogenase-like Zn-dependent alcohol dehydrogenase
VGRQGIFYAVKAFCEIVGIDFKKRVLKDATRMKKKIFVYKNRASSAKNPFRIAHTVYVVICHTWQLCVLLTI